MWKRRNCLSWWLLSITMSVSKRAFKWLVFCNKMRIRFFIDDYNEICIFGKNWSEWCSQLWIDNGKNHFKSSFIKWRHCAHGIFNWRANATRMSFMCFNEQINWLILQGCSNHFFCKQNCVQLIWASDRINRHFISVVRHQAILLILMA